jgi:hypothetical protein
MTRYYAIKMAKRSGGYLAVLLFVMVGSHYAVIYDSPVRFGLPIIAAVPFVCAGVWLLLTGRRPLQILGGVLAVGTPLLMAVAFVLYVSDYVPKECHGDNAMFGWYVHCHESGWVSK